ncbi:MAG: permease-like cell division protein FtsX [Lachnospirales bacterium]
MKLSSIKYFFKEAFINLSRNTLLSIASILTISSCIFFLLTFFNLASNIDYILENLENSIGFSVFINDEVSDAQVVNLKKEIEAMNYVESVTLVSSEEAFDNFSSTLGDRQKILSGLPRDTLLPRSFNVLLEDSSKTMSVISLLKANVGEGKYYSSINHAFEETQILITLNKWVRIFSLILIIGLAFIATVIIFNTIKIGMNSRRYEIGIMKYIGSTDWFIRWPFIIEGMLIGFIGSVIPTVLIYSFYNYVMNALKDHLSFLGNLFQYKNFSDLMVIGAPMAISLGVFIGMLGSLISIRKFLKV